MRTRTLLTTAWMATAALAAGGATTALAVAGGGPGSTVLSRSDVQARLAGAGPARPLPGSATVAGPTSGPGAETSLVASGGTLVVRCHANKVTGFRVVPKPGWSVTTSLKLVASEPTSLARPNAVPKRLGLMVDFRHPSGLDHRVMAWCAGGRAAMIESLSEGAPVPR